MRHFSRIVSGALPSCRPLTSPPLTIASINSLTGLIVEPSSSWLLIFSMQRLDGIVALEEHLKTNHWAHIITQCKNFVELAVIFDRFERR